MPYEEAVEMLKKSIKKMYGKKAWWCLTGVHCSMFAGETKSIDAIARETRW